MMNTYEKGSPKGSPEMMGAVMGPKIHAAYSTAVEQEPRMLDRLTRLATRAESIVNQLDSTRTRLLGPRPEENGMELVWSENYNDQIERLSRAVNEAESLLSTINDAV